MVLAWCSGEGEAGGIMDDLAYAGLKRSIKERIGIDIDAYKGEQMRRRLENFVLQRAGGQPAAWLRTLPTDVTTLASMREMLTINVSEFFRDAPQFDRLERVVLPSLLKEKRALNIWSAACSNGQEPYSLAILLNEAKADAGSRILATDFDRTVLERARSGGPYGAPDVRNLSAARLSTYFAREGAGYLVTPSLRSRIQFREHNLLSSAYGTGYDLIVCRNVLIYFSPAVKMQIVQRFQHSLRPGGVLFIGATEALLGADTDGFKALGGNFYEKEAVAKSQSTRAA